MIAYEPLMLTLRAQAARIRVLEDFLSRQFPGWNEAAPTQGASGTVVADEGSVNGTLFIRDAYVTAKQDFTNIRQYPDIDSEVIRQASQGETLMSDAAFNRGPGIHVWYRIKGGGFVREDVVTFSADKPAPAPIVARWPAPIDGYTVTNTHGNHHHTGVDLAAPIGTPVRVGPHGGYISKTFHCQACGSDVETQARMGTSDPNTGYGLGNYVVVRYSPLFLPATVKAAIGEDSFLYCLYAHLSKISVTQGAIIEGYGVIGDVGTSGNSTGSHLHIQCRFSPKSDADFYSIRSNEIDPDLLFNV